MINVYQKCIQNNPNLLIAFVDHLLKINKELKNLKKQEIQAIFTKMNLIKHAFNKNPKYDGYQIGLASMVYIFFDKKRTGGAIGNNEIKQNLQLAKELYKPVIRKFKKGKFVLDLEIISGKLI